jgi:hypothetical protein
LKGKSRIFEKTTQKTSLHMKRKLNDSKNAKYFDFSKMDKNKCPKLGPQKPPY